MNPANKESGTPTYCHYSEAYPFVNYQNQKIYQDFDKFCLFKPFFLSNLVDRNDHIDISFYLDNDYVAPSGLLFIVIVMALTTETSLCHFGLQ